MKKYAIATAALVMLSASGFAQKDELKALKKMSKKKDMPTAQELQEFKNLLNATEAKLGNADDEQKAEYYYYKGGYAMVEMGMKPATGAKNLAESVESFNKVLEIERGMKKKEYTQEIREEIYPVLKNSLITQAQMLGKQDRYKDAYPLFEQVYRISPTDTVHLYNAAAYAVNGQEYNKAIEYYKELQRLGFTGKSVNYTARNIEKNEVEYFGDKKVRDLYVANKTHDQPGIFREESKKGDIVKNIALIYINQGEKEKAKNAIMEARKLNPDDTSLILAEAQFYLEAKDYESYKKAVKQVLDKGSKDPNLYFNLGVTSAQSGQIKEAEQYYNKAIELKPDFVSAYYNLGILKLNGEEAIVKEMNDSKTSDKRYNELKKLRNDKYKDALTYLEKAYKIEPDNQDVKNLLGTLYQGLEMMDKYKALKATN